VRDVRLIAVAEGALRSIVTGYRRLPPEYWPDTTPMLESGRPERYMPGGSGELLRAGVVAGLVRFGCGDRI
jgi:hypothetical protein